MGKTENEIRLERAIQRRGDQIEVLTARIAALEAELAKEREGREKAKELLKSIVSNHRSVWHSERAKAAWLACTVTEVEQFLAGAAQ